MTSPDLSQSDIDRIFNRIQETIDLSKIKNKSDLNREIRKNPKTKYWNNFLNNLMWDLLKFGEEIVEKVPEIEVIPIPPREKLTSIEKRRETRRIKENLIDVKESKKQKAYSRTRGRLWQDVEIQFAARLRKDGLTYNQIGKQLNRTQSSVSTKFVRLRKGGRV